MKLLCRVLGHAWGPWTRTYAHVTGSARVRVFSYRWCRRCPTVQERP